MTKDYAKRKRAKKNTNTRTPRKTTTKRTVSPILVFLSGILITLFVVFLWALIKKPEVLKDIVSDEKQPETKQVESQKTSKESKSQTKQEEKDNEDTEFTYHETLINKEVDVKVTKPKATDSNKSYIMQCGAFKELPDAEKMKAELAFVGFQTTILTKGGWHRVRLGPYNSKRNAESDRHKLQDNNYLNCQIW